MAWPASALKVGSLCVCPSALRTHATARGQKPVSSVLRKHNCEAVSHSSSFSTRSWYRQALSRTREIQLLLAIREKLEPHVSNMSAYARNSIHIHIQKYMLTNTHIDIHRQTHTHTHVQTKQQTKQITQTTGNTHHRTHIHRYLVTCTHTHVHAYLPTFV